MENIFIEESESDFIPLLSQDEDDNIINETNSKNKNKYINILYVRHIVLFPFVVTTLTISNNILIELLHKIYYSNKSDKIVGILTQKNKIENPTEKDLYTIGTVSKILKLLKLPNGNITVIIKGIYRFKIKKIIYNKTYLKAEIIPLCEEKSLSDKESIALIAAIKEITIKIIQKNPNIPSETNFAIRNIESYSLLINFIATNMHLSIDNKQKLLEYDNLKKRAMEIFRILNIEYQYLKLKNDIQSRVRNDIDQQQREYFLHQEIKAIQEELGDFSYEKEFNELRLKGKKKKWSKEAEKHFEKELCKLQRINPQIPEYTIIRNYLDTMLDLPWYKYTQDNFDLNRAKKILNKNHYGIENVKKRIIEHLAVLKLKKDMRAPILCLYGPPGVGKTSLGKSIALALNRKYLRISLGGVHDEAEIRGHRKTYIGAMLGRMLQSIKKAGTSNPVFILDEIDKLGISHYNDPAAAMLEVLDPEQNMNFYDNYLELNYDLSQVMFIATANSLSPISPPLLDRMEIIEMNDYSVEEKIKIFKKHIFPKQLKEHCLKHNDLLIGIKQIEKIIESYTREAGVRNLEKCITKLIRYAVTNIAMGKEYKKRLTIELIEDILGPPQDPTRYEGNDYPGVVTGLAWTNIGGDILFIESSLSKGKGELSITGNLGEIMKESATIALQYIKAHYEEFGVDPKMFEEYNVHIHVPEGAVPKDGPSAGVTMLTSLVSSYTNKKLRPYIAMTGEITLRGKVLPVGGIKEKILAAKRANIKEIILSKGNQKDIKEINPDYLKGITFKYVNNMNEVINIALL